MTVSTTDVRFDSAGNGVTTDFSFNAKFFTDADIKARVIADATGVESVPSYTIVNKVSDGNGGYSSATVRFAAAPASGTTVVRYLDPALTQETNFQAETNVLNALNRKADLIELKLQRAKDLATRSLRVPEGVAEAFDGILPAIKGKAGYLTKVNATETGFDYVANNGSSNLVTATGSTTARTLADWMAGFLNATAFTSGDATPSVLNGRDFVTAGSTAITNFDDGTANQVITVIRGDSDIVITDNANIDPLSAGNITLTAARPLAVLRNVSGVWKEVYGASLQSIATDRLIGRDTAGTGDPEALTVGGGLEFTGSGGIQRSALTGDVAASAGSNATTIANDAVTYAKMQNAASAGFIGATGAGDYAHRTYAQVKADLDLEAGTDFLSPAAIAAAYQPLDSQLTAFAANTGVSGTITVSTSAPSGGADGDIWLEREA